MSFGHQMLSATCFCRVFGVEFELEVKATITVVAQLEKEPKNAKKTGVLMDIGIFRSQNICTGQFTINTYIHGRPTGGLT